MLPCKHKDRKNIYSDFQLRANMDVKQNLVTNTIISCPLRDRCNCQFQAKIIETSVQTILFIADLHTAAENVSSKDRSNSLKHSQRHMIASAVKVAHIQSPGKLIRNIRNSPTKEIDAALRKSVVRLVRKERRQINFMLLEGVAVDNTIGRLAKLADAIWFGDAVNKHIAKNVWTFSK